ncbi:Protein argonaute, variant 2 [Xanthoria parietina]
MDNPFAPDGRWHPDPIILPEAEHLTMRLEDGTPVRPPRQQLYHAELRPEQVLKELMKRPGYGNQGKNIQLRLNSHVVSCSNEARIYQYAVQVGTPDAKRGLIKNVWCSNELATKIPGGIREWIYDGNALAWSKQNLSNEFHAMIDLDKEKGRDPSTVPEGKRDLHRVAIRKSAAVDLQNIYAYLEGRADFGPGVIDAINFLDHVVRETPSNRHINIKKSYFDWNTGDREFLGGGVEAMRGIYQSIRMAEGKRLVINVDVSHTCFWNKSSFPMIINQLSGHMDLDSLGIYWRDVKNKEKTNALFQVMKRLKRNNFYVNHKNRSERESKVIWKVHDILPQSAREFKFKLRVAGKPREEGREITLLKYYEERYNIWLQWPDLPVVQCTKKNTVYPMEACMMCEGQRFPYKLNDHMTTKMLKFAVQPPEQRLQSIQAGTRMLGWDTDPVLKHYELRINPEPIVTKARVLNPPTIQFNKSTFAPGTKGRWDLRGKKFLAPNEKPLKSWGIAILNDPSSAQRAGTPNQAQVRTFIQTFIQVYQGHGGIVETKDPDITGPISDPAKASELLFYGVGNKYNARPQLLIFILPNSNPENYLRIKKSCDCRFGAFTQCLMGSQVIKNAPQYHSNVLMKVNAKLGGTTARVATPSPSGHFSRPTMIIGADVSHAAPGIGAPSFAAMTVSMDKYGARYAAGVQTNGYRVEMISTRNLKDMLIPLIRHWTANVSGGRLPEHIYYFRDGVSEGQFLNVIHYEVGDIKSIFDDMIVTPQEPIKFTVVVAEKRHHIRFFPGKAGDENQNALPGTLVDRDVTHAIENDIYLCSHKALKGTARPTHYHMLLDEANVPVDVFQKMLYEHSYQYMRSTTPVSLFPAVYYAHLASNRARSHEDIAEPLRKIRDAGNPSGEKSGPTDETKPLLPMVGRSGLPWGMWYI